MEHLEAFTDLDSSRMTLIKTDGTVVTDSDADAEYLDNHLGREEIQESGGGGGEGMPEGIPPPWEKPCSMWPAAQTMQTWCCAWPCPIPASANTFPMLFPAAIVSLGHGLLPGDHQGLFLGHPSHEDISGKMMQVKGDYTELHFESCQYPEINVIAETITNMSQNVKEYLSQIEKENRFARNFSAMRSMSLRPHHLHPGLAELLESGMIQDEAMKMDFRQED